MKSTELMPGGIEQQAIGAPSGFGSSAGRLARYCRRPPDKTRMGRGWKSPGVARQVPAGTDIDRVIQRVITRQALSQRSANRRSHGEHPDHLFDMKVRNFGVVVLGRIVVSG